MGPKLQIKEPVFLTGRLLKSYRQEGLVSTDIKGWINKACFNLMHPAPPLAKHKDDGIMTLTGSPLIILTEIAPLDRLLLPAMAKARLQAFNLLRPNAQAPLALILPLPRAYKQAVFLVPRTLGARTHLCFVIIPSFTEGAINETMGGVNLPILI